MRAKHTKGPWDYSKKLTTSENERGFSIWANGWALAEVQPADEDGKKGEANARLIAAAPDLLEALQAIVKSLADQDDEGMIEHAQPMISARAAIAKATGEKQ